MLTRQALALYIALTRAFDCSLHLRGHAVFASVSFTQAFAKTPWYPIMGVMTNGEFVQQVEASLSVFGGGSLCIWGQWFGRPYDNYHRLAAVSSSSDHVTLSFASGETLAIWSPVGLEITHESLRVRQADRVRWEWYYYGPPQSPDTLCFEEYVNEGARVVVTTNVHRGFPRLRTNPRLAAVEIFQCAQIRRAIVGSGAFWFNPLHWCCGRIGAYTRTLAALISRRLR